MALYKFKCPSCKKELTKLQKYEDTPPLCECGENTERAVARSSFALKGSGWYQDGY